MALVIAFIMLTIGIILYKHKQNYKAEAVVFFATALVCIIGSVKVTFVYQEAPSTLKEDSVRVILHSPDTIQTSKVESYSIEECVAGDPNHYGNCIKCSQ
jgi:uncharacterized membrane protein